MKRFNRVLILVAIVGFVGVFMIPIYAAILGSLTPFEKVAKPGMILPVYFTLQNYIQIWSYIPVAQYLLNTTLYTIAVSLIVIVLAAPAAYIFSRNEFKGKSALLALFLITQLTPPIVIISPLFATIQALKLLDSYFSVILVLSALWVGFPIWFLKSYFDTIPKALDEAGLIDGCSNLGILFRIVLPVSMPGLLSCLMLVITLVWQEFLVPLIFITKQGKLPITVGTVRLLGELPVPWNLVMTMVIISVIPTLIPFIFFQRFIIEGVTAGAGK